MTIKYRKARIFYDYNHFDKAVPLFQDIVEKHTSHELAEFSANLLTDSLNAQGKPREVARWVDRFMEMPELMKNPEFAKQMVKLKVDTLAVEGYQYQKQGNFKECGRSLEAAAASMPDDPNHAVRLYDAAGCFQNARLVGLAVQTRNELIRTHPTHPLAQKALYRIASGYHQLAFYEEAAKQYEAYATKFPGEKEAPEALGNAYDFRVGLKQSDKAIKDLNDYIRFYGGQEAAGGGGRVLPDGPGVRGRRQGHRAHQAPRELHQAVGQQGIDREADPRPLPAGGVLLAEVLPPGRGERRLHQASSAWRPPAGRRRSTRSTGASRTSRRRSRRRSGPSAARPPSPRSPSSTGRGTSPAPPRPTSPRTLKLFNNGAGTNKIPAGPDKQTRVNVAIDAAAGARFYQGEKMYEDFLKLKFPEGLEMQPPNNFDSPKKAKAKKTRFEEDRKKLLKYMTEKSTLAAKLAAVSGNDKGIYNNVLDYRIPRWVIAASARMGQIYANFVDQLYTAPIPRQLKTKNEWGMNEREIFCDALVDQAEPVELKAVAGYELCLKAATKESWFNEWSAMCEVELNQMQPSEYPLAVELRPEAEYVPTLMTPAKVVPELSCQVGGRTAGPEVGAQSCCVNTSLQQ